MTTDARTQPTTPAARADDAPHLVTASQQPDPTLIWQWITLVMICAMAGATVLIVYLVARAGGAL